MIKTVSRLIRFLVFIFFILIVFQLNAQLSDVNIEKLDSYIEKCRIDWNVPGMVIAIVKNDTVIFTKAYGVKSIKTGEKVDINTVFGIASNSKAFTSAAMAILVDEGKINWDDKVIKYLPYFELYDTYVSKEMTIRDLLCHRSGLKTFSGDLLWYASKYAREEIVRKAKYLKPSYSFRSHYGYSNIMFLTAGLVIEKVSGKSWDDFVFEHFLEPLDMNRSTSDFDELLEIDNLALPHIEYNNSLLPIDYVNWNNMAPAGGLNSTITDMTKWLKLQLNHGKNGDNKIFSSDVSREMWLPQTIDNIAKWEEKVFPSTHFHTYGLGWDLFDLHGRKVVNHNGGLDGMISQVVMVPEENFGFVILTNSASSIPFVLMYYILDSFLDSNKTDYSEMFLKSLNRNKEYDVKAKEEALEKRIKNTKPSLDLYKYEGRYHDKIYGDVLITFENKSLHINFEPTSIFVGTLQHWNYDVFQLNWDNPSSLPSGEVEFFMNDAGAIVKMLIDVPNPDFDFTEYTFIKVD